MYSRLIKPIFDATLALVMVVLLLPLWIIVAVWIKMDSPGPIFFVQERIGRNGRTFKLIKFRTMTHQHRLVEGQTYQDDPAITNAGKVLRRLKIDELPQLLNILGGDMAIVGPRPCLQSTCDRFGNSVTIRRFEVKPGLTSPAGVNGSIYLSWPEKWWYDKWYVENISFITDLRVVWRTLMVVMLGEKRFLNKPNIENGG